MKVGCSYFFKFSFVSNKHDIECNNLVECHLDLMPHHADILEELKRFCFTIASMGYALISLVVLKPLYTDRGLKISFFLANSTEPDKLT